MKANIANRIVVIGLGMTGISVVKYLVKHQPDKTIQVIDTRINPPGEDQLPSGVALHKGSMNQDWLCDAQMIVVSPGIALATPELQAAAMRGVEIIGDIELFARAVQAPVVGITGSNGKSTVTNLVGAMAKAAGLHVGVGGNIGFPALALLEKKCDLYVLELSSFQLETTHSLQMKAATFLNFSEDHMDRYAKLSDYLAAKKHIYTQTQLAIWNQDDAHTKPPQMLNHCFGFSDADYCLMDVRGVTYLSVKNEPILPVSEIGLIGRHNIANCLAAMALADAVGIERHAQIEAMKNEQGLAHRCQKVIQHQGVTWINDSKATNLASTIAALDGLAIEGHLHLLVGGDSKGADLSELKAVLAPLTVTLYCFGRDAALFLPLHEQAQCVETLSQAMDLAYQNVQPGDLVLLSPACASLDQFSNFMARGQAFVEYARQLCGISQEQENIC